MEEDTDGEPERPTLHRAHRIALRAAPYILWVLGIYLILTGTLGVQPEPEAISSQALGVVLAITGAVVTRAKQVDASREGVKAEMAPMIDLDRETVVRSTPGPNSTVENRSSKIAGLITGLELVEAAEADGWTVQRPRGERHLTLVRANLRPPPGSRFNLGDSVTINLPLTALSAPAPPHVIAAMEATGFVMPS